MILLRSTTTQSFAPSFSRSFVRSLVLCLLANSTQTQTPIPLLLHLYLYIYHINNFEIAELAFMHSVGRSVVRSFIEA